MGVEVNNVDFVTQEQINLAENARKTEHILILEVGAVAPLEHKNLDAVFSGAQVRGKIKLAGHVADLTVADEGVVDEEVEAGIYALEGEIRGIGYRARSARYKPCGHKDRKDCRRGHGAGRRDRDS